MKVVPIGALKEVDRAAAEAVAAYDRQTDEMVDQAIADGASVESVAFWRELRDADRPRLFGTIKALGREAILGE